MLNETDEAWLRSTYPALVSTGDAVSGIIDFLSYTISFRTKLAG
jgi:hypothetical protein